MPFSPTLNPMIHAFAEKIGPERARQIFYLAQVAIGVLFVAIVFRMRSRPSGFGVREADLRKPGQRGPSSGLAQARIERKSPLQLEGIRIQGASPHEVLGLPPGPASEAEIQKAYRERMKRYHPDKIGRPGTREWEDAQKIAEAINLAKAELLRQLKSR